MGVRKRGGVYHYQFQSKGVTYCGTLPDATTDAEARAQEADEKAKVRLGLRSGEKVNDNFKSFVDDVYLKYSKENKESHAHDEFRCKVLADYFIGKGLTRFRDITTLAVVGYIKHRLATKIKRHNQKSPATKLRSPVTVHKEVTQLSEIFNMAMQEKVTTENPCRAIPKAVRKMIRARSKRQCAMTPEKEAALFSIGLAGRYAHLRPVCLFDLHTGLRLSEATQLERGHFNLSNEPTWVEVYGQHVEVPGDCFVVVKSKTGKSRVIPLNAQARKVAAHQLNDATVGQFIFPSIKTDGQIKEVKKGLAGACKQAGIKYGLGVPDGITFHSLRHWFSSKLEDLGVSKTVRRDLLGHEPRDMTDDYTHSTIEMRRRAVSLLCQTSTQKVVEMASKSGRSLARG
jgi:integrase